MRQTEVTRRRILIIAVALVTATAGACLWLSPSRLGLHSQNVEAANVSTKKVGGRRLDPEYIKEVEDHYPIPSDFNSSEVRGLKRRALLGDNEATLKLSEYYENCMGQVQLIGDAGSHPPASECGREAHRWMEIAAQNGGNPVAAEYLFGRLVETGRCVDVYRARFWLERAMADPNKPQDFHIITDDDLRLFHEKEKTCRW